MHCLQINVSTRVVKADHAIESTSSAKGLTIVLRIVKQWAVARLQFCLATHHLFSIGSPVSPLLIVLLNK
eukprot:2950884-Pyramimonas_sp.AAC.2